MINDFVLYSLKSVVIFSLLFIPYFLFRGDTFFVRNRLYLLLALILSLVLPLLSFNMDQNESRLNFVLSTISINEKIEEAPVNSSELLPWLVKVFLIISGLFLLRFFVSISNIILMILRNPKEKREKETIVWMKGPTDFSFFRYIFLSRDKYHPSIHQHERIHVQRFHSVDIILFELFRCFQWYNPLVWVALSEIRTQHEYEADELTVGKNKTEYQALLLSLVLEKDLVHMTNSFYYLTIKKRFTMMNKKRSPKRALTKTLAVLPFVLLSAGLFSNIHRPEDNNDQTVLHYSTGAKSDTLAPEFKGGNEAFVKYLSSSIKYPEKAKKDKKAGIVVVSFVIDKSGKVKNTLVKEGVSPELDKEALRVINSMPAWKAGSVGGKAIETELCVPISFKLD